MLFAVVPSSFLCSGQQICRWFKRRLFVGHFDGKQKGQSTVHLKRCCRNAVLFFLIRDTTLSSPAFECGRIRTVLATSFILPNLWVPFPSFNDDRYPQITSMRKLGEDFSSFSSLANFIWALSQTFLGKNGGQIQLDNMHEHGKLLRPLAVPMAEDTSRKVQQLITVLYNEHHISEMTEKWLCQTPVPPRIPVFYILTKIHKPTWETSGVSGPTEKLSALLPYYSSR